MSTPIYQNSWGISGRTQISGTSVDKCRWIIDIYISTSFFPAHSRLAYTINVGLTQARLNKWQAVRTRLCYTSLHGIINNRLGASGSRHALVENSSLTLFQLLITVSLHMIWLWSIQWILLQSQHNLRAAKLSWPTILKSVLTNAWTEQRMCDFWKYIYRALR